MSDAQQTYDQLLKELREITLLGSVGSLLGWDERTNLPTKGAEHRGNQLALIARMTHERFTDPKIGKMLGEVEASNLAGNDPSGNVAVNLREARRSYDRAVKLPPSLVEEMAKTEVLAQHDWVEARKHSNYAKFQPWLEKWIGLKRQEANCVGFKKEMYDALLDPFEPYESTANVRHVLETLRKPLVELIGKIVGSSKKAPLEILEQKYPAKEQELLAREASKAIGFDFDAGRLDISVHPFCSGQGPGDTRMTTRYDENFFGDALFGTLHETGHALYEQGLPNDKYGQPICDAISLGIHESQSRMWENMVGRSRAFWKHFMPRTRELFASQLKDVNDDRWYFAINDVRPSFIRTESDEATYNLHILLRFEMEQDLIGGNVSTKDLPEAWNKKMKDYLGIVPPDDAKGCLQDIHWSGGAIGYFSTYTLGNLYAAQFFEQARKDLGDLDAMFAKGEFAPLLGWLRKNIHSQGKRYPAAELVKRVTGQPLSADPLMRHLKKKAAELYGV